jgi:FkbM family methyltransferase
MTVSKRVDKMNKFEIIGKLNAFLLSLVNIGKVYGLWKVAKVCVFIALQYVVGPPHKEMTITTKYGYKMHLIPQDRGISTELRLFKVHEPLATKIVMKELKDGKTIVDVGSNIGYYAIFESILLGRKSKVIAIEPIQRNFQYLLRNIAINRLNNVKPINMALSDEAGVVKMVRCEGSNWSHVLDNENQTTFKTEEVVATTGDKLLESINEIGLIRLDVEGHEYHIIRGCCTVLRKWYPDVLIEVHPSLLGGERLVCLLRMFRDFGYNIKHFIPRNVDVPLAACDDDITRMDINELISYPIFWNFMLFLRHSSKL